NNSNNVNLKSDSFILSNKSNNSNNLANLNNNYMLDNLNLNNSSNYINKGNSTDMNKMVTRKGSDLNIINKGNDQVNKDNSSLNQKISELNLNTHNEKLCPYYHNLEQRRETK